MLFFRFRVIIPEGGGGGCGGDNEESSVSVVIAAVSGVVVVFCCSLCSCFTFCFSLASSCLTASSSSAALLASANSICSFLMRAALSTDEVAGASLMASPAAAADTSSSSLAADPEIFGPLLSSRGSILTRTAVADPLAPGALILLCVESPPPLELFVLTRTILYVFLAGPELDVPEVGPEVAMNLLMPPAELMSRVVVVAVVEIAAVDMGDACDLEGDKRPPILAPAVPDFNAANCSGLILIILGALFC